MCKILAMAGIKPDKEDLMWQFLIKARPLMTLNDRDGIGYAAMGSKGIWGERWRFPEDAWSNDSRKIFTKKDAELAQKFNGNLEADIRYTEFGSGGTKDGNCAVIYHSRLATCDKTIDNVHPFVRGNTALIHNGIIRNAEELKMHTSTCDSETILNEYVDDDVTNDPDKIQETMKKLKGYYGCAVLTINKEGKKYLDLFRHKAPIYAAFVEQLGATVYCTSDDIIKNTCKEMKFSFGHVFKLKEEVMLRIDATTGMLVLSRKFTAAEEWSNNYYNRNNSSSGGSANAGKQTREIGAMGGNELTDDQREILGMSLDKDEKKTTSLVLVPTQSEQEKIEETRSQKEQFESLSKSALNDKETTYVKSGAY